MWDAGLVEAKPIGPFRLLALDVDGTLLDSTGTLRPATAAAVARAAAAGIRPLLCTGRRYRRALPVARQLRLEAPLVCNSGAILKEPIGHKTLWRADFDGPILSELLCVFQEADEPILTFTDHSETGPDFLIEQGATGRPHFDDYVDQNREYARISQGWPERSEPIDQAHFHVCAIGSRSEMLRFERAVRERLEGRVRTFVQRSSRYSGTMCEVIRGDASKWAAILQLAGLWGISAAEIVAIGDDMNDLPMIEGAGLGVAMGHAPEAVRSAADLVTGEHDRDGVALLVNDVLLPF